MLLGSIIHWANLHLACSGWEKLFLSNRYYVTWYGQSYSRGWCCFCSPLGYGVGRTVGWWVPHIISISQKITTWSCINNKFHVCSFLVWLMTLLFKLFNCFKILLKLMAPLYSSFHASADWAYLYLIFLLFIPRNSGWAFSTLSLFDACWEIVILSVIW